MADRESMNECNKQLLKAIEDKLDDFFAKKLQNGGSWRGGVGDGELRDLIEYAAALYNPFEAETVRPIPQVNEVECVHVLPQHPPWNPGK